MNRCVIWYNLAMIWHRSKNYNIKDGKMVLIAYHMLESSICAYIEWLFNKLMMTANKIEYKDARLVIVGTESDQLVNICSFAVRCDRRWPSTQWHRIYTSSDNVPYVQSGSVGDFIPEPRCSKSVVGLQTRERERWGVWSVRSEGLRSIGAMLRTKCPSVCLRGC